MKIELYMTVELFYSIFVSLWKVLLRMTEEPFYSICVSLLKVLLRDTVTYLWVTDTVCQEFYRDKCTHIQHGDGKPRGGHTLAPSCRWLLFPLSSFIKGIKQCQIIVLKNGFVLCGKINHVYYFNLLYIFQATDADPDEHTITTVENPAAIVTAVEEPVPPPEKVVLPVRIQTLGW